VGGIMTRSTSTWLRRGLVAAVLVAAAVLPGHQAGSAPRSCPVGHCHAPWTVRWIRGVPGSWQAVAGAEGTVLRQGEAYAAAGYGIAAIGFGRTVEAFGLSSGAHLWTVAPGALASAAPGAPGATGAAIVSVRAWPGVVTVGVTTPPAGQGPAARQELVLSARTGRLIRSYPAAEYGGAVTADLTRTVVVGTRSVTCYRNATGRPIWRRATGTVAQAWRVDGGQLYVTISAEGYLGTAPVTALRRINLTTGAQRIVRPASGAFAGTLSGAFAGVTLFSSPAGLSAYSATTGQRLWHRAGVVPETFDAVRQTLYVARSNALIGVNPATGAEIKNLKVRGSSVFYLVRDGVALALDQGSLGAAWGYDLASHRVIWTSRSLPWPHYFADLSGLGGSSDPGTGSVVLTACGQVGNPLPGGSAQECVKPELVTLSG
jgi:outer membrane protein assembly factor BamB